MSGFLELLIFDSQQNRQLRALPLVGALELGRQQEEGEPLLLPTAAGERKRVAIVSLKEVAVARKQLLLQPLGDTSFRLSNLSDRVTVQLQTKGTDLKPLTSCEASAPEVLQLGSKVVRIQQTELQSLEAATSPPGEESILQEGFSTLSLAVKDQAAIEKFSRWLQKTLEVLQSAAASLEFFARAARAVVDAGLDSGRVLLRAPEKWSERAVHHAANLSAKPDWQASQRVLSWVVQEKRTFWQAPAVIPANESLLGVDAVVAAPILNRAGEVIGALYGERLMRETIVGTHPITNLEALLVELLASGVAAGLVRIEHEQEALRSRVQFEQFFTKELAQQLTERPDLLLGRDLPVTVLVCDIRGFSRISERLGPAKSLQWINDVLEALSECVLDHKGVVVDYVGDELLAMWGAPVDQPDQAERACQAALAMLQQLPGLNERWQGPLKETMDLGIGICSGLARVGNVGSRRKFKYGPLGNTVNLASRIQGVTKFLKTRLLLAATTKTQLHDDTFTTRRLCRVRVVNIDEPVDLYELPDGRQEKWPYLKQQYEEALKHFETQQLRPAVRILGKLVTDFPGDGPSLVLISRAINALVEQPEKFEPVWQLTGK